jgi:hypothetical protein
MGYIDSMGIFKGDRMHIRLLQHRGRTRRPQVWEISVAGKEITTTWGTLGGSMQTSTEEAPGKYFGQINEVSPEEHAIEIAKKRAEDRQRSEGYRVEGEESDSFTDVARPPPNLRMFKPLHNMNKRLESLLARKEAISLRKHDGYGHPVVYDEYGYPRFYTSKMESHDHREPETPWAERYPALEEELRRLNVPPNSMLLGELVASSEISTSVEGYLVDDFEYVGKIVKSLTPKALSDQQQYGPLGYVIWDVAFWEGECLLQTTKARTRLDMAWKLAEGGRLVTTPERVHWHDHYFEVESVTGAPHRVYFEDQSPEEALLSFTKSARWEGFVIIDPEGTYGDKSYSLHGKPVRPSAIAKLKPDYEADVIVRWDPDNKIGKYGKGKHQNGVGSVAAYLWHPSQGEVSVGKVGIGISDENTVAFANPALYPMIWQISFKGWTAKGMLRHASFERIRDDKTPEECDYQQCPILRTNP